MATKVHMEALSPTMEEGQLVRWLKAEGDAVASGDVLAEIETDKATMELVARGDGVLRTILLAEGDVAPVGDVIAIIATPDEDLSDLVGEVADRAAAGARDTPKSASDRELSEALQVAEPTPSAGGRSNRVKASPLARRLASEAGVDLAALEGSGPGGRIVKRDVEAAVGAGASRGPGTGEAAPAVGSGRSGAEAVVPAPLPWSDPGAREGFRDVPVSQMRKTIARRLTESLGPVPHFFLTVDVDMGRVMEARARVNELAQASGDRISFNDFVLKACAATLVRHPGCNAAWQGDRVRWFDHVHIGVAVAVEEGLITPVVRHADRKGLLQISREVKEMAGRARERTLKPEEYTGSTFSVSNLGMFGIREFTAIINPPEAGILAVGGVEDTPVVQDGEVVVRPRMRITMSCDHRVIDGAQGARFLKTLRTLLEEPAAVLL